jgi:sugar phosphate isomerase/epimerase
LRKLGHFGEAPGFVDGLDREEPMAQRKQRRSGHGGQVTQVTAAFLDRLLGAPQRPRRTSDRVLDTESVRLRAVLVRTALQLYSLRDDCARDLLATLRTVADMGYEGVEFAGLHGHDPEEVRKALDDAGLAAPSCHAPWSSLQPDTWEATAADYGGLGCRWLIVPGLPIEQRFDPDAVMRTAERFVWLAEVLRPFGMSAGYHCHEGDLRRWPDGSTTWDIVASNTPDDFIMQLDTSNAMDAGADPAETLSKWPGRGRSVHLKEHRGPLVIGEGAAPWNQILDACETTSGTEWYVVEHEIYGDSTPLDSVQRCLEGLRRLLATRSG